MILALLAIFSGLVAVMRGHVPRVADSDVRERPLAAFARHHEREDVRELRLESDGDQVGHQRAVRFEGVGDAERLDHRHVGALLRLAPLNSALDLPHVVQVIGDPRAVARTEARLQRAHLVQDAVEDASILAQVVLTLAPLIRRRRTAARMRRAD